MFINGITLHILSIAGSILLTVLCCYPVLNFIQRGFQQKKISILRGFTTKAKRLYLLQFLRIDSQDADKDFEKMYKERYSKSNFYGPAFILVIACFSTMYVFSQTAISHLIINGQQISRHPDLEKFGLVVNLPSIAVAGLSGAYLWVVTDLIGQTRRNDFRPGYLLLSTLRLIASVPIGYAVASLATAAIGPFVAFSISAFPLDSVRILLRRLASDKLGLAVGVDGEPDQIKRLSGIDTVASDTFQDVGITTVPQLAYCDPVQISIKTGFDFGFIVDVVGQALAWIYFGDKLSELRILGLRSSVEIGYALKDAQDISSLTRDQSKAALAAAAAILGVSTDALLNAATEIAEDPFNEFLTEVWGAPDRLPKEPEHVTSHPISEP